MSLLTDTEYLIRHEQLHRMWHNNPGYFSYLSPKQQRDLHDYYQTTSEGTDAEFLARRGPLTETDLSLPHRASRAFLALLRPPEFTPPATSRSSKNVMVRPAIKPDIDVERLANALVDLVASLPQEERDRLAHEGRTVRERREKGAA